MKRAEICFAVLLVACGGNKPSTTPIGADAVPASCASQTAELKTWLAINADPAQKVAAPFPTGDAAFDAELDKWRAHLREVLKPADPSGPAEPLATGVKPGPYDALIASCEPAKAATKEVSLAESNEARIAAWSRLADAIAACDCKPAVAQVKAHVYIIERGPD